MFGHEIPQNIIDSAIQDGFAYVYSFRGKPAAEGEVPVAMLFASETLVLESEIRGEMNSTKLPVALIAKDGRAKGFLPNRYFEDARYEGRLFIHGAFDCFTLLSDYFEREFGVYLPWNVQREMNWWQSGKNLYLGNAKKVGFEPVTGKVQKGDVLTFAVGSETVNHAGIYLGDHTIMHHLGGRFSCIEKIGKGLRSVYRGAYRYG
jgi:hypothetical protein